MTSQKSFFKDMRLMKTSVSQNKYVLFLYTAVLFLIVSLPGILMRSQLVFHQETLTQFQQFQEQLTGVLAGFTPYSVFGFLVLGFITAVLMFSFLYQKTAVNFFHSTPYRRHEIYWARFLGGIVLVLLPLVLVYLVNVITAASASLLTLDAFGQITYGLFLNFLYFLTVYCVSVFCATLSGNIFAQICLQGFVYLVYPVTRMVFTGAFYSWFETFQASVSLLPTNMSFLFPAYQLIEVARGSFFLPLPSLLYNIGYCVVFALAGLLFYCIRKSENCNKFYTSNVIAVFLKYYITTIGAVGIGVLFYTFSATNTNWIGGLIATVIAAVLLFAIIQAIFAKNIKAMFTHKKQFGVFLTALILVVCVGMFDILGFDTRVPKATQVVNIAVSISQDKSLNYSSTVLLKERENVEKAVDLMAKSAQHNSNHVPEQRGIVSVAIQTTTSPFKMRRTYSYANQADIDAFLSAVQNTAEYKDEYANNFPPVETLETLNILKFETSGVYIDFNENNGTYRNAENVKYRQAVPALRAAFQSDVQNTSYEQIKQSSVYAWIRCGTWNEAWKLLGEDYPASTTYLIPVYNCYANTIAVLETYFPNAVILEETPRSLRVEVASSNQELQAYETQDQSLIDEILKCTTVSHWATIDPETAMHVFSEGTKLLGRYDGSPDIISNPAFHRVPVDPQG